MKKQRGFTLIEMLCVLAISGIVLASVTNILTNVLQWGRWGVEEEAIGNQMEHALDLIENDVRGAKDIDVAYWEKRANIAQITSNTELHLTIPNDAYYQRLGTISYVVKDSGKTILTDTPLERPRPGRTLYRSQIDSGHSGNNQSVAMYLNSSLDKNAGFRVWYYNQKAQRCSLMEDVYSVKVVLSGVTKDHVLVTRTRYIPLTMKYE